MALFVTVVDLPDDYLRPIAKIIMRWSVVELLLKRIACAVLSLDQKQGRIALREPRGHEQISMIQQLMALAQIDEKQFNLASLKKPLEKLEQFRDRIAHGLWGRDREGDRTTYFLRDLSGHWDRGPHQPKLSRRVSPAAEYLSPQDLMAKERQIHDAAEKLHEVLLTLEKRPTLPRKPL